MYGQGKEIGRGEIILFIRSDEIYSAQSTTLYMNMKVSKGYTPKGKTEKKYYQSTKKRNLLLRKEQNRGQVLIS